MDFTQGNSRHHLHVHDIKRLNICEMCHKGFSQIHSLEEHFQIHTKKNPYVCEMCNMGFSQIGYLIKHTHVHTNEKPYVCGTCNKRFSHSSTLNEHLLIHTKEKFFFCEICNKGFSKAYRLKRHLLIHTKEKFYVCEMCSKCFARSGDFKRHLRIHTKEKPHFCETCNKSFSLACNLKAHLFIHTKEKPYVCEICNKGFSESAPSFQSQMSGRFLKVTVSDEVEYRDLSRWLENSGVEFKSFMLKQDRPVEVVVRGLPSNTEPEDIKTEIEAEGFKVIKISQMKNYWTKAPMPLFYVQIENGVDVPKIYDFTELFGTRIEVKPFDHGNKINQCCRCQGWFHSSEVCHLPPRCVRCAGPHSAKDCTLEFDAPMKCANCSGEHAAN
ncbi:UNVERIFIED_CONTAM: zinc finger protein [Trichonephila clavipes]